jgi:hypothetical protein
MDVKNDQNFRRMACRPFSCAAGLLAIVMASGVSTAQDDARPRAAADKDRAWVRQRVEDWQPTRAERAFEEIGWAGSLVEAQQLAQQHGRGIFLFTYDGASLSGYRC